MKAIKQIILLSFVIVHWCFIDISHIKYINIKVLENNQKLAQCTVKKLDILNLTLHSAHKLSL